MDERNAKNYLQNFIQNLRHQFNALRYDADKSGDIFHATVELTLDTVTLSGAGMALQKKEAEKNAAQDLLDKIFTEYPELNRDWDSLFMEAQAGDALIKLAIYLSDDYDSAADKSYWLQKFETDAKMEEIYDYLKSQDDPRVRIFGSNLGKKKKATFVEAIIWREFGAPLKKPETYKEFSLLTGFLERYK